MFSVHLFQHISKPKIFSFHPAEKDVMEHYPHTHDPNSHGFCGPIHVSMAPHAYTIDKLVEDTLINKGVDIVKDPYGGNVSFT